MCALFSGIFTGWIGMAFYNPIKLFASNVVTEELKSKTKQNTALKRELLVICDEIWQSSYFRYLCILKIMSQLRSKQFDRVMKSHTNKIAKLLHRGFDVDTHINNISTYKLSFFQKLVLCRGLKFSLPQDAPAEEIQASFEKKLTGKLNVRYLLT